MLKGMILSEMEEARNKKIPIVRSTDQTFLEFVNYIVNGKVPNLPDCEQQMDLYRLAHLSVHTYCTSAV